MKVEKLHKLVLDLDIFGAERHGFELNPVLTEKEVQWFEKKYKIKLPLDYREFLLIVGNGGAGPADFFKLGEVDDGFDYEVWKEGEGLVGILSKPFPHTSAWNDLIGKPTEKEEENAEDEDELEKRIEEFDEKYQDNKHINGAIPICHLGCANRLYLVVNGIEKGNIWCDDRADYEGVFPLTTNGLERVSFYQWYLDWLDYCFLRLQNYAWKK